MRRGAVAGIVLGAFASGCESLAHRLTPADRTIPAASSSNYYGLKPKRGSAVPSEASVEQVQAVSPQTPDTSERADYPIDLETALRLAGAGNPTVALAAERVNEALADQLAARSMLLPSLNAGANYRHHTGPLQGGGGVIRFPDSQNVYIGAGAFAVGGGTVGVPGARLFAHLGDAAYAPLAARQRVAAVRSDSLAVQNVILRDVAVAYLELVAVESRLAILKQAQSEIAEIVRLTAVYAEKGQGRASDAHRAAANSDLLQEDLRRAEEDLGVANVRLCGLLNLDPSLKLRSPAGTVDAVRLIPEDCELESLVSTAVASRPEVYARSADIGEADTRRKQERVRPWLPTVSAGYSYGLFGGGSDLVQPNFSPLSGRSDFDISAVWSFENLGLGNRARVRRAEAGVGRALSEYDVAVNLARREVAESLAAAQASVHQIGIAKSALAVAEEGYTLEQQRIKQGQGRPIEVLDSFRQAVESRQELLRATVAFNQSQFRLLAALGRSPDR